MLAADGDVVVFADADMATPPDQLPGLIEALGDADVALGSRIQPDGSDMRRTQPGFRRLLGKLFHALAAIWVTGPVRDTQCGFKGFTREAAQDLFARQRITSIVFDVELIYLARRRGYRVDGRADPVVRPARLADADPPRSGAAGGLGPVPHPVPPPWGPSTPMTGTGASGLSDSSGLGGSSAIVRALPVLAIVVAVVVVGAVLASAGPTLGYDTNAYLAAARRLLDGSPVYDTSIDQAGAAGLYYYSPPFTLLAVPFALLPAPLDVVAWMVGLIAAFGVGVAILPVSRDVRWLTVLLAGLSWPFAYAIKLGQVGPILFLLFAIGWRWMDRPGASRGGDRIGHDRQAPAGDPVRLGRSDPALDGDRRRSRDPHRRGSDRDRRLRLRRLGRLADDPPVDQRADHDPAQLHAGSGRLPDGGPGEPGDGHPGGRHADRRRPRDLDRPALRSGRRLPHGGDRKPAPVAGALGSLRDAPAAADGLVARPPAVVGRGHPAGHVDRPDRPAAGGLPGRLLGRARRADRGRRARPAGPLPAQRPGPDPVLSSGA